MKKYGTTDQKVENLKKIGVVLRPSTPELKEYFFRIRKAFESHKIEIVIDSISGGMIGVIGVDFDTLCKECDLILSVGGDGTLISTVRRGFRYEKPVLGVNMGNLGFLTDVQKNEIEIFANKLVLGDYRIDNRMLIEASFSSAPQKKMFAFNDIVINRKHLSKMVHIKASIDKEPFNIYYGDGLIISTPTGSTAYNISAGGPVVYPFSQIFVITPICPHSLSQRPLVMPSSFEIDIELFENEEAVAIFDGQEMKDLDSKEIMTIKIAPIYAKLIHRVERNYFSVLREKFKWGNL